jgi:hypothetical protein
MTILLSPFVVGQPLIVTSIDGDTVTAAATDDIPIRGTVFDVYTGPDEDGVYREQVDSVYFVAVSDDGTEFVFQSVWLGGGLYLATGYALVPAGRAYNVSTIGVRTLVEEPRLSLYRPTAPVAIGIAGGYTYGSPGLDTGDTETVQVFGGEVFGLYFGDGFVHFSAAVRYMTNLELNIVDLCVGYPGVPLEAMPNLVLEPAIVVGYWHHAAANAIAAGTSARMYLLSSRFPKPGVSLAVRITQVFGLPFGGETTPVSPYFSSGAGTTILEVTLSGLYSLFFGGDQAS